MTDPIFQEEQEHLSDTYAKLKDIEATTTRRLDERLKSALKDRDAMQHELTLDLGNDVDTETYVEIEAMHKIIDAYNLSNDLDLERLESARLLLEQPYFAKVTLKFASSGQVKELYIGSRGIVDDDRRRFIIDWRSPVAEVYYNQANGRTSYQANGRTIECELTLRRQFDIEGDKLNAYFDTTIAIEDPLLLASLSRQRSQRMKDITATIQKEQNQVIRHDDVPVLLVNGIAGSGKTSVLLQRIAYLLYQRRGDLDPKDVYLITPNELFGHYISNVLPEMGETNPQTTTWENLARRLGAGQRGLCKEGVSTLKAIDRALENLELSWHDFQELCVEDERVITMNQIKSAWAKYQKFPTGPKRVNLANDELMERLEQRIARLCKDEDTQAVVTEMTPEEQIATYGQYVDTTSEEDIVDATRTYLEKRYEPIRRGIENSAWLRVERIGMGILKKESLSSEEWIYLKMALSGSCNRAARYVMIDEVQDYTEAQILTLCRYFSNAHFLLLGDENQAIKAGTASFERIHALFAAERGSVSECKLLTSYRSSPEITQLFARLAPESTRMRISSVQPSGNEPLVIAAETQEEYLDKLKAAVERGVQACSQGGLAAVIANDRKQMNWLAKVLKDTGITVMEKGRDLPQQGVCLMDLPLAKGLEFDEVILADAGKDAFGTSELSRHRLYTAISRATQRLTLLSCGPQSPLLKAE